MSPPDSSTWAARKREVERGLVQTKVCKIDKRHLCRINYYPDFRRIAKVSKVGRESI